MTSLKNRNLKTFKIHLKHNKMNNFLRFCSIVSILIMAIKIALIGNLTPGVVVFIIICGLLILIGNKTIYIITAAGAAILLFIKVYGGGSSLSELHLLGSLLTLSV